MGGVQPRAAESREHRRLRPLQSSCRTGVSTTGHLKIDGSTPTCGNYQESLGNPGHSAPSIEIPKESNELLDYCRNLRYSAHNTHSVLPFGQSHSCCDISAQMQSVLCSVMTLSLYSKLDSDQTVVALAPQTAHVVAEVGYRLSLNPTQWLLQRTCLQRASLVRLEWSI